MPIAEAAAAADADSLPATVQAPNQASHLPLAASAVQSISAPETLPAESSARLPGPAAVAPSLTNLVAPIKLDAALNAQTGSEPPLADSLHPAPKAEAENAQSAASDQKAKSELGRTVAGMRQVVEKRLAAIVAQDKLTRETQWQQALIYTTLQYAWTGRFDEARQVAQHPALPAELQTELLAKITMIQLERQPNQLAGSSASANPQANANATAGRSLPPGYIGPSGASYSSVSLGQQCPIAPVQKPAAQNGQSPVASGLPAKVKRSVTQAEVPAFVPALSQNLAGRLVQISQLPPKLPPLAEQQVQFSVQPPELFVGIAGRVQSAATAKPTAPALSNVSDAAPSGSELRSQPIAEAQRPQFMLPEPPPSMSFESGQPAQTNHGMMPAFWGLDQLLDSALNQSLEQFSFILPDWISAPLQSDWSFWTQPSPTQPSSTAQPKDSLPLRELSLAASSLTTPQLSRDMRKLPVISTQPVVTATAQKMQKAQKTLKMPASAQSVLYDTATLLAASCAQAQLTHYSGDQVIDQASAKRMGWVNLMFPLPVAALLTSAFGWRVHPISGALSFHTGLDLGAPMGTPVLAAAAGRVMVADQMGGYGLAVVVEAGNQRNLYGHLSGIAVQPGTQVAQGAILGWVGSTGNSTGPHLHFESQVSTSNGWTAVNPIASATLAAAGQ